MAFKFCPKCGRENTEEDLFCSDCGHGEVEGNDKTESSNEISASVSDSSLKSTEKVWVSLDGETVKAHDSLEIGEDVLSTLVLRGHYTVEEDAGFFYVSGKPISNDCYLNRLRRLAVENYKTLQIPDPMKYLISMNEMVPGVVIDGIVIPQLRKADRKYKKLLLTDYGFALMSALGMMGGIWGARETFDQVFSGERDLFLEDAAGFVAALFPALESIPNEKYGKKHEENEWNPETDMMLETLPSIPDHITKEEIGTDLDMPFYSPVNQLVCIAQGLLTGSRPNEIGRESDSLIQYQMTSRLREFALSGFNDSNVPNRIKNDNSFGLGLVLMAQPFASAAFFEGEYMWGEMGNHSGWTKSWS